MSAGLGEAGSVTVVQFFGVDGGEVVDGFVGSFGVEPGDPVGPAASRWSRSRQGPCGHASSDLNRPIWDSVRALSSASPTDPTDGSMPASTSRSVKAIARY